MRNQEYNIMFHVFEESWTAIFRRRNENEKRGFKTAVVETDKSTSGSDNRADPDIKSEYNRFYTVSYKGVSDDITADIYLCKRDLGKFDPLFCHAMFSKRRYCRTSWRR